MVSIRKDTCRIFRSLLALSLENGPSSHLHTPPGRNTQYVFACATIEGTMTTSQPPLKRAKRSVRPMLLLATIVLVLLVCSFKPPIWALNTGRVNSLMVVCHPDDESVFGASALGPSTYVIVVTDANSQGRGAKRRTYLAHAMSIAQSPWEMWMGWPLFLTSVFEITPVAVKHGWRRREIPHFRFPRGTFSSIRCHRQ